MENYIILYIKQESRMEKYGKHLDHCRSVRIVATCGNWHHWPIQWRCAFLFKKTVQIKCAQKQDSLKMFKVPLPWNGWTIELNPLNPANPITKWSSMSSQEAGTSPSASNLVLHCQPRQSFELWLTLVTQMCHGEANRVWVSMRITNKVGHSENISLSLQRCRAKCLSTRHKAIGAH